MDGIKLKQDGLAKYLRGLAGDDCSLGLHEIGLNSRYENKEEAANNIMREGLDNKRGGTTYFTVAYYGKKRHEFDINNYNCYGSIYLKTIVVVAIPEAFEMSNGSTVYGGVFNKRKYKDDQGHAECLTDYVFQAGIPSEFILGYYTYDRRNVKPIYKQGTRTIYNPSTGESAIEITNTISGYEYGDATFYENPKYYSKLSQEEKDSFISSNYKEQNFFNINNEQSINDFYRFGYYYITMDGEESFVSKTIKQYEQSKYYKNKELKDMIKDDNYREVIPGFKVLSRKDQ